MGKWHICLPKKKTIHLLWSEYHITQQLLQASNNKQLGRSGNQAVWSVGGKEPVIYSLSGQPGAKEGKVQTNQGKVQTKQDKVQAKQGKVQAKQGKVQAKQGKVQAKQGKVLRLAKEA